MPAGRLPFLELFPGSGPSAGQPHSLRGAAILLLGWPPEGARPWGLWVTWHPAQPRGPCPPLRRCKPTQIRTDLPTSTATTMGQATGLFGVDHGSGPSPVSRLLSSCPQVLQIIGQSISRLRSKHHNVPLARGPLRRAPRDRSPAQPPLLLPCPLLTMARHTGFFSVP